MDIEKELHPENFIGVDKSITADRDYVLREEAGLVYAGEDEWIGEEKDWDKYNNLLKEEYDY